MGNVTFVSNDGKSKATHKEKFEAPKRKPTKPEERILLGKAIEVMIKAGLENHVYRFHNKLRIQKTGGPIGLALTGEVADCYMLKWDVKFLDKLKMVGILPLVYSRLKDDILIALEALEKGTVFVDGKLTIDEKRKMDDENKSDTQVTLEILKDIAESVDPMLKFTIDTPCSYSDGKMPALDIKVSVNIAESFRIDYEFFEKPTRNPRVILADSALSAASKRTILTQECLRRIRNTKVELGLEIRNKHLSDFMLKLKNSGYSTKYRMEILNSAVKAFEKMLENDRKGIKPLFRDRNWNKEERLESKKNKKINWYKDGGKSNNKYKSVLFVPPTPGGILARELKIREEELNRNSQERIKIVEKGGIKVENILTKKDPFVKEKCSEKLCPICKTDTQKMNILCNPNNVVYRWTCCTCWNRDKVKVYEGETSRSARLRGIEHVRSYLAKREDSVLYKHKILEHKDEEVDFQMEITGVFKDPLSRQAEESVRIQGRNNSELMNSKSEFNHPPMARIVVEREKIKL